MNMIKSFKRHFLLLRVTIVGVAHPSLVARFVVFIVLLGLGPILALGPAGILEGIGGASARDKLPEDLRKETDHDRNRQGTGQAHHSISDRIIYGNLALLKSQE